MGINTKSNNRLFLGIFNVGFWFLVSIAILLNQKYLNFNYSYNSLLSVFLFYAIYILFQFPFDILGANLTGENNFNKYWLLQWLVGSVLQFGIWGSLTCFIYLFSFYGGITLATFLLLISLPFLQGYFSVLINKKNSIGNTGNSNGNLLILDSNEKSFTGGVVFQFFRKINIISKAIYSSEYYSVELQRRSTAFNVLLKTNITLILWNLIGVLTGEFFNIYDSDRIELKILYLSSWMTIWSFISLILFTRLSHNHIYACDRTAANDNKALLIKWIKFYPSIVGENGHQNQIKQSVFYPVPRIENRIESLNRSSSFINLGNLTRQNLFISWAVLNLSARSVHCNVGRPLLWVLPPS